MEKIHYPIISDQYRRRWLKMKPLQCKTSYKIKQIRSEYLAQKHEKSEFSNRFQDQVRTHILYQCLCNFMQIPFLLKF